MFRDLRKDEIDVRVAMCKQNGVSLLLYKDARVDQDILDETVGAMNWQRKHTRDNANCIVEIWDDKKQQWISKEDTGTESNTEKEKGLASDSFKRACVNWGIGRELYTTPFIWVNSENCKIVQDPNRKDKYGNPIYVCSDKFTVEAIQIENKKITGLAILCNGKRCFEWGNIPISEQQAMTLESLLKARYDDETITKTLKDGYKVNNVRELDTKQYVDIVKKIGN